MLDEKPKIFLGSSKESLPELAIVKKALTPYATVVPWTDRSLLRLGGFFLNSLLNVASTFDFAVFVFGANDVTISRNIKQPAPRDNVIFEAGLFMAHLGSERVPVIAPRNVNLKILSDFAGLVLAEYKSPDPNSPNYKSKLSAALKPTCEEIVELVKRLDRRQTGEIVARPGPFRVSTAGEILETLLKESAVAGQNATVQNIALDMEMTWPLLKDRVLDNPKIKNLTWQSLMIDPASATIKKASSDTVSIRTAVNSKVEIRKTGSRIKDKLDERSVNFECRAYANLPLLHGFLIDPQGVLLLTFCDVKNNQLIGRPNPYWRLDNTPTSEISTHFFSVFRNWFAYYWKSGSKVWPQ
jgi:hypothetical protein